MVSASDSPAVKRGIEDEDWVINVVHLGAALPVPFERVEEG